MKKALIGVILTAALLCCFAAPALAADGWVMVTEGPVTVDSDGLFLTETTIDDLFLPLPSGVAGVSVTTDDATRATLNSLAAASSSTTVADASVQPKMGDTDITWAVVIGAIAAAGLLVSLKKRAQA